MYIELKDINKTFGNYKASDHVEFGIEKGKLVALLGPSGSGKTTILRMIVWNIRTVEIFTSMEHVSMNFW